MACTSAELQETLDIPSKVLTENGLKLNMMKSEVTAVHRAPELHVNVNGKKLNQVLSF